MHPVSICGGITAMVTQGRSRSSTPATPSPSMKPTSPLSSQTSFQPFIGSPGRLWAALSFSAVAMFGAFQTSHANVITNGTFDTDLSGWTATSDNPAASWTWVDYGNDSIGQVAQFQSGAPFTYGGSLSQPFMAISGPITLTFDANWLFGATNDPTSSLGVMLLDDNGDGYVFYNRHNDIGYGVTWQPVVGGVVGAETQINVDTQQLVAASGGGMGSFSLVGDGAGNWTFSGSVLIAPGVPSTWTTGSFSTGTDVTSFSEIRLTGQFGANNVLTPLYDNVVLVPEPSTLILGAIGFVGVLLGRRQRREISL